MPIYTIAQYRVRPEGVEKVQRAIREFVPYVRAKEPGSRMYLAWQQQEDPTRFVHFFIFEDEAAHEAHSRSEAVKQFESAYRPELAGGDVVFTDYDAVASNQDSGADIRHAVAIEAAAETIYPLFASAEGFRKWWAEDVTEEGGAVHLGFYSRSTIYRLRAARANAPLEAEWAIESGDQWSGTRLSFRIEQGKSGSLLRFTHANWRAATDYFTNCNTTWGELMYRLKAAAEGKAPGPLFSREGLAY